MKHTTIETILVISILISTVILGTYTMYQINTVNYYQIIK
jgi:hypothetical protein